MKSEYIYLDHMLQRCEKIRKITSSVKKEAFFLDEDKLDLVVHSLEIIGEATTHISEEFKKEHDEIPWQEIKDFRNVMSHQYFRIDPEEVWTVANTDIEDLYAFLIIILNKDKK